MSDSPWWWDAISYLSEPGNEWFLALLILLLVFGLGSALLILTVIWLRDESIEELRRGSEED
ncbi:MAG: hypothetical protein JSW71_05980 [Gemmatimonadota bacterium]|nr:MAG: hypothetical protein JSW71_05980 [Gemmatimonadota bacterium]